MTLLKSIGLLLVIIGVLWLWYCFDRVDESSFKAYSIPRDLFTGIAILILGVSLLCDIIEI